MDLNYNKMTRNDLLQLCRSKGIKGYSTKNKEELKSILQKNDKSNSNSKQEVESHTKTTRKNSKKNEIDTIDNTNTVNKIGTVDKIQNVKDTEFSELSYSLTKELSATIKKNNGIFFTPKSTVNFLVNYILRYCKDTGLNITNILEPSCGSCEMINAIDSLMNNVKITGVEYNDKIYNSIKNIKFTNDVSLLNDDFLRFDNDNKKYDLIIGNPPYFVMKKEDVDKKYNKYYDGRPNIYVIFIAKCLELLETDGLLAFVLPKNFLNCLYYDALRKYIYSNYSIVDIICDYKDKYIDTQQETCLVIIQNNMLNNASNKKFTIECAGYTIFNSAENIIKLGQLYHDSITLNELGFNVKVGNVVWNQHKDILTNDSDKTLLIYSSNIKDNTLNVLTFNNEEKKQYINKNGLNDLMLVINRGYGKGEYSFEYLLIDIDQQYLVENHLICIVNKDKIPREELMVKYQKIIDSFEDTRTKDFIGMYFENNSINTTELQHILPIY